MEGKLRTRGHGVFQAVEAAYLAVNQMLNPKHSKVKTHEMLQKGIPPQAGEIESDPHGTKFMA